MIWAGSEAQGMKFDYIEEDLPNNKIESTAIACNTTHFTRKYICMYIEEMLPKDASERAFAPFWIQLDCTIVLFSTT
jgi:hypothetical protein